MSLGDLAFGAILDLTFTTRYGGVPTALSGGVISVYKTNSVTQSTAGVTLTASFDSVTGFNHVRVDTTADATFYAAGCDFTIMLSAGTVGGVSVVGVLVDDFSIAHRAIGAAAITALWDEAVDGAVTARESLRLANSANGGILSGAATSNVLIRDLADTMNRVDATVDSVGNRTAVTVDLT